MEMSVVMPLYRVKHIGWLAFESLIRQIDINFEWELIIIEENTEEFLGRDYINSHRSSLKKVGCTRLLYFPIFKWISLSKKYKVLTELCNSKLWTLAVGDYYSASTRLKTTYDSFIKNNWDFYKTPQLIFYDFVNDKWVVRRVSSRGACCKATRMSIAKQVFYEDTRWYGLDGWFYRQCIKVKPNLKEYTETSTYWKDGFNTHGFNNLSHDRTEKIKNNSHKFLPWDTNKSNVPKDILDRLNKTRKNLDKHKVGNFN
jgi:hypothetical protein